jgi:ribonuclease R
MMRKRGLALGFEKAVEREARLARDRGPSLVDGERRGRARRDLRELPTFTIDPATARDFDDAISAALIAPNRVQVWVHIADVSAFVPEGSAVDLEARRRGTSVYAPGVVEPMLPAALSNDACSLTPGAERLTVTVELEIELATGQVSSASFYRSLIRSNARLDYEQVDRVFTGEERPADHWARSLQAARQASAALERERARRSGALTLAVAEPEFTFDEDGSVAEISMRVQTESYRLIEHLMIAANEAVARLLARRRVPCLYRVHGRPEPAKVKHLVDQLVSLHVATPPLPENISPAQATTLMGEISRLLEAHVARSGGRQALTTLVLQALQQAYYTPKNLGHSGLGSACYCHFTSPIRRYPDLVCHRALLHTVGADVSPPRASELTELGEHASQRERDAMALERDGDDIACCFALEQLLYERGVEQVFAGEITGLIAAGAFIAFGLPGEASGRVFEGMLPARSLRVEGATRDWWELGEEGTTLHGQRSGATLRLGEEIEVRVARVDAPGGRVDLLPNP